MKQHHTTVWATQMLTHINVIQMFFFVVHIKIKWLDYIKNKYWTDSFTKLWEFSDYVTEGRRALSWNIQIWYKTKFLTKSWRPRVTKWSLIPRAQAAPIRSWWVCWQIDMPDSLLAFSWKQLPLFHSQNKLGHKNIPNSPAKRHTSRGKGRAVRWWKIWKIFRHWMKG